MYQNKNNVLLSRHSHTHINFQFQIPPTFQMLENKDRKVSLTHRMIDFIIIYEWTRWTLLNAIKMLYSIQRRAMIKKWTNAWIDEKTYGIAVNSKNWHFFYSHIYTNLFPHCPCASTNVTKSNPIETRRESACDR